MNLTLRPYQQEGVRWMTEKQRCILADDMGTGKTVQSLMAIEEQGEYPCLVICPASLKLNWEREANRWLPHRTTTVIEGSKGPIEDADIVIVNYDLLTRRKAQLLNLGHRSIVMDEAHYVKNKDAARSKAALELAWKCWTRILLTGTPLLARPIELVNLLKVIGRLGEFGGFQSFADAYCDPQDVWTGRRWVKDYRGASNLGSLNRRLFVDPGIMLRRTKKDVLPELPATQYHDIPVEIENRSEYKRCEDDLRSYMLTQAMLDPDMDDDERRRKTMVAMAREGTADTLVRIEYLRQVAARGKVPVAVKWVKDFLEDTDESLVIFAHHRDVIDALSEAFPDDAVCIRGGDSSQHRQDAVDAFQTKKKRIFIGSIQAAGVGLTLTAASNCLFLEFPWSPSDMRQATDRINRMGQAATSVTAHLMVAKDTIDEAILELLEAKAETVDAVMGGA